ncbi:hypothetical protein RBSWK_04180 [Rhodopirellula baltica SWK14]|uniref:Uncharacterized protein n=1 Tax=Rhodopirellula baltica SWK14 TaxID=993516 RepID=L7CBT5_RHOBT|nr:hypothetical protein RBSWK_04180 [Rhodopirellula baltica SWK14]
MDFDALTRPGSPIPNKFSEREIWSRKHQRETIPAPVVEVVHF